MDELDPVGLSAAINQLGITQLGNKSLEEQATRAITAYLANAVISMDGGGP